MTKDGRPPYDDQLDAYLDGMLGDEDAARFEAQRANDATFSEAVEAQRGIDASLATAYEPPPGALERSLEAINRSRNNANSPPVRVVPLYRKPWAVAAMILVCIGASWQLIGMLSSNGRDADIYAPKPLTTADAFYRQAVASGFKPDWVCETDDEFATTFRKRFRQPLLLEPGGEGVSAVGLSYLNWLSGRTTALLARSGGKPVVVFVDQTRNDQPTSLPPDSGLNIFRAVLGKLVLYEVTPLDESTVIKFFYNPDDNARPVS